MRYLASLLLSYDQLCLVALSRVRDSEYVYFDCLFRGSGFAMAVCCLIVLDDWDSYSFPTFLSIRDGCVS